MKNSQKVKFYAEKIWELEQKCQKGEQISDSIKKMDEIANRLTVDELFAISQYIENHF